MTKKKAKTYKTPPGVPLVPRRPRPVLATHPKSLVDATVEADFEVLLGTDTEQSIVRCPEYCAGSRAIVRVLPGAVHAWVQRSITIVEFETVEAALVYCPRARFGGAELPCVRWRNPKDLQRAVVSYDDGAGLFPPGKYRLLPVFKADRLGTRKRKDYPRTGTFVQLQRPRRPLSIR